MTKIEGFSFDLREHNAVLAGLRLLEKAMREHGIDALPPGVYDIMIDAYGKDHLSADEIDILCEELNE